MRVQGELYGRVSPDIIGGGHMVRIRAPERSITHTARATVYPDGRVRLLVSDVPIFREPGWEAVGEPRQRRKRGPDEGPSPENLARSARRARQRLYDLAWANPQLRWFCTLTLDADVVGDRYDVGIQGNRLRRWLDNQVRRRGLAYIIVPEYHRDGAIHWHGLFNDALDYVDGGTVIRPEGGRSYRPGTDEERARVIAAGGHVVYNIVQWRFGFSTAVQLYGRRESAVGYVSKYICKAQEGGHGHIGGRWYWHGGQLVEPQSYTYDIPWDDTPDDAYVHTIPQLGARCKIIEYYPDDDIDTCKEG